MLNKTQLFNKKCAQTRARWTKVRQVRTYMALVIAYAFSRSR